ncbi:4,5-epoxidase [Actinopolymorpha cephalotaxi]|uniref:4,5-epoxidase n=1 Tax=Actinopolymorpha cephalotaxi TaxID=504797 RepID=A0A1I2VLW1_9ACTN|nr:FAD-dependent monooxygenase [Actinopolymorpha cephalotaxi]NYH83260.1 4,5-epoxidase [Actinopolymorpha cephalotaxi]SFG90315.1 4,5-epoxidase [Actinopolymorpha cephalotaxi]
MDTTEVLVVGAGPTGLTLACVLRLHGVAVRVVDRAPGPATTSRANFLHARGSEVLHRLGALGTLPEESLRAMRITTYLGDRPVMTLRFGDPGGRTAAPPMVVSQAKVEAALRDRLADLGGAPEWNTALVDVDQDADGVTVSLADGQVVRAGWVIGCDGTGSTTRKLAGVGFPGVKLSERFLLADLRLDWDLDRSGTSGWIHPAGMLGAMPMPDQVSGRDDLWRLIAYDPGAGDHDKPGEQEILHRLRRILPERTGRHVRIGEAEWVSQFTIHRRLAERYRSGRVFLAGDAAHAHAPFGGQGMLTGVGDAENLAWKLALVVRGRADAALLDTYEAERRPLATEVLRGTANVTKINIASSSVGRFLRDHVLVRLFNLAIVQRWTTYTTSQLWVSYRKGPLGDGGRGARPRPGDRVSDRAVVRADGSASGLHAELGGRWALVVPQVGADELETVARQRLGEHLGVLRHDEEQTMLVRPDAHLAWRGSDPAGLERWLDGTLRRGQVSR